MTCRRLTLVPAKNICLPSWRLDNELLWNWRKNVLAPPFLSFLFPTIIPLFYHSHTQSRIRMFFVQREYFRFCKMYSVDCCIMYLDTFGFWTKHEKRNRPLHKIGIRNVKRSRKLPFRKKRDIGFSVVWKVRNPYPLMQLHDQNKYDKNLCCLWMHKKLHKKIILEVLHLPFCKSIL